MKINYDDFQSLVRNAPPDSGLTAQSIARSLEDKNYELPDEVSQYSSRTPKVEMEKSQGFFSRIGGDIEQRGIGLREQAERLGEDGFTGRETKSLIRGAVGQSIGGAFDIGFETVVAGLDTLKAITPDAMEGLFGINKNVAIAGKALFDSPVGQAGIQALEGGSLAYQRWKEENPSAAFDLESTLNIVTALPIGKGIKAGAKGVKPLAKSVSPTGIGEAARTGAVAVEESLEKQLKQKALDLVTPSKPRAGSKAAVQEIKTAAKRGEIVGGVKGASKETLEVAEEVSKIKGLTHKNFAKDLTTVAAEQSKIAKELSTQLKNVPMASDDVIPVIKGEMERLLVAGEVSKPAAKLAKDMIIEMERLAKKNGIENLDDVWSMRKGVDDFVRNTQGDLPSGVRREGIDLFRRTANEFIDRAAPTAGSKNTYKKWSVLERGTDVIANKATRQAEDWIGKALQTLDKIPILGSETRRDVLEIITTLGVGVVGASTLGTVGTAISVAAIPSFILYKAGKAVVSPTGKKLIIKLLKSIDDVLPKASPEQSKALMVIKNNLEEISSNATK